MKYVLRKLRLAMVFCVDILMIIFAWYAGFLFSTNFQPLLSSLHMFLPCIVLIQGSCFYFCGLYRGMWRFASIPDLVRIIKAVTFGILAVIVLLHFCKISDLLPRSMLVLYGFFLVLFLSTPRILFRWLKDYRHIFAGGERVLIVGAGNAGESLVRDLRRVSRNRYQPVAFVDDNAALQGKEIHGIRVRGRCPSIPRLVETLQIELIFIATPSATSAQMRQLVMLCEQANVPFRTLPGIKELVEGRVSINELREVSLEDLLGREQVNLAWDKIRSSITDKVILVTGGGGSIGDELCTQIAALAPELLIIIENCEFNLYQTMMKLNKQFTKLKLIPYLTSVTDKEAIKHIFDKHKPELIFHVAAYKHVPLLEEHLRVAIYNNIIGTRIVAEAAAAVNSETFVLISTDKAVNPTNIMGATKRASEIVCQSFNFNSTTNFITVRFGNVLDSAGSVIPLFRRQLQNGGPITVTHPDMTRFFMTIPEACQLILQAACIGEGNEIFVLDMGEPVKISYLAEQLIKLSGKLPTEDIGIEYIGLRPGEKLYEELFYKAEELSDTIHPKIKKGKAQTRSWVVLVDLLMQMEEAYNDYDETKLLTLLCKLVPEYSGITQKNVQGDYLQIVNSN